MKKTIKSVTKASFLTIATLSAVTIGLTFCQNIQAQAIKDEQSIQSRADKISTITVAEQMEITFGKPILQEEILFDKPINTFEQTMSVNEQQLQQYNWQLKNAVNSQGQTIVTLTKNPEPVVLNFAHNQVKGREYQRVGFSVGCNSMSGSYHIQDNQLSVNSIMSTRMYCENMAASESLLAKLMEGKNTLSVENNMLSQATADGSILTWQGTPNN